MIREGRVTINGETAHLGSQADLEKDSVKVDSKLDHPNPGDIYLLCSDGLSGPVPDPELLRLVEENKGDLKAAAARLIARANENGGPDNITACLIRWIGPAN